jgi:hypothetical protein
MAGMLPLLVSRIGHHTDLASQEEMCMVIKEAQEAKHNLEKQISRTPSTFRYNLIWKANQCSTF